ncbi:MAG TPA: SDR family oxidoreductase [Phycisphaerae bacterium]|nr:SDR family oxidoreductase [Phycisphaerae bacterium]
MSADSIETVVITGASGGVGRATVREFAKRLGKQARLALLARNVDALFAAKREVEQLGAKALVIPTDVSKSDQVFAAAERAVKEFGPIDVWINNAMVSAYAPFIALSPEEFAHITEVTYLGQVYGTMAALRNMVPRDKGTIVQIGSALAKRSIPLQSAYCGAKHAIVGFSESIRTELFHMKSNVHITLVHLPGVNTTQFEWTLNKMPHKSKPVGTIYQPEVAADAIFFAAHHKRKEFLVGWPTIESTQVQKIASSALDHYLASAAWDGSQRKELADHEKPNNFWKPVHGDRGSHGPFDPQSKPRSLQVWANKNRNWIALGAATAALTTVALAKSRRNGN